MAEPNPKVVALMAAQERGEEAFYAAYDELQPSADEVGEFITLCGRLCGIRDQDILETLEQVLEERGL